jgi:hypothetical protein
VSDREIYFIISSYNGSSCVCTFPPRTEADLIFFGIIGDGEVQKLSTRNVFLHINIVTCMNVIIDGVGIGIWIY